MNPVSETDADNHTITYEYANQENELLDDLETEILEIDEDGDKMCIRDRNTTATPSVLPARRP